MFSKEAPIIFNRIKNFLEESVRIREFAHTILHNHKIKIPRRMFMHQIKSVPDGGTKKKKVVKQYNVKVKQKEKSIETPKFEEKKEAKKEKVSPEKKERRPKIANLPDIPRFKDLHPQTKNKKRHHTPQRIYRPKRQI